MTTITLPRATVEQALHVAENAGYPLALIKALRAALAQQAESLTIERLRDALVASRIIPPAAVEDPDGYDDGLTQSSAARPLDDSQRGHAAGGSAATTC